MPSVKIPFERNVSNGYGNFKNTSVPNWHAVFVRSGYSDEPRSLFFMRVFRRDRLSAPWTDWPDWPVPRKSSLGEDDIPQSHGHGSAGGRNRPPTRRIVFAQVGSSRSWKCRADTSDAQGRTDSPRSVKWRGQNYLTIVWELASSSYVFPSVVPRP